MRNNVIHTGSALDVLRTLPAESVHCCVTSPPYWGLRDYGHDDQIGLERTPEEYVGRMVEIFREVRRVLRNDGTLWLNLGDSYARSVAKGIKFQPSGKSYMSNRQAVEGLTGPDVPDGLKPKDLVGIPWAVAKSLQQPYYTGQIKAEADRVWLAAAIDSEGCMFIHKRKAGQHNGQGYVRKNPSFGAGLEVANTSELFVQRCMAITGLGSICRQDKDRRQPLYRWNLRSNQCREIIREVYPHFVAKKHEARLLLGCPSSGELAAATHTALIGLHNGHSTDVDFPPPASMYEQGWYLRSDIIWNKSNPMPESVTDRPTKAHEYIFLLSKSSRYYYNAEAIKEPAAETSIDRCRRHAGFNDRWDAMPKDAQQRNGANRRTVWTIATAPYKDAHFATFPPKLIEPCILAGSSPLCCSVCGAPHIPRRNVEYHNPGNRSTNGPRSMERKHQPYGTAGFQKRLEKRVTHLGYDPPCEHTGTGPGIILDPFIGSGTTASVAVSLGRDYVGIELNPEYVQLAEKRLRETHPALFPQ